MSEHVLTPEEKEQFISAIESGEIVLEPIIEESPPNAMYATHGFTFRTSPENDILYFEKITPEN